MDISWGLIREIFFAIGSLAGIFAFIRPVFDNAFKRDQGRVATIKDLLPEAAVVELQHEIYLSRYVSTTAFRPFLQLQHDLNNNMDSVRFSGPLKKYYRAELARMIGAYRAMREYVQVPWWNPVNRLTDGVEETFWDFDKTAFFEQGVEKHDYAKHLDCAADCADRIKVAYQRLQIVSDMHLLEAPFAFILLPRRYKANAVKI